MFNGSSQIRPWNLVIYNTLLLTPMISSSFDFLLQSELENFQFYQWRLSISVFKLFYSHNMRVKESNVGFRVCEWSSGENQFSPVTSLRFLNYRWWPIPHFSGIYFVCICEHICLTGYNELFLGKGIKIAINLYTKTTLRNCLVIDYSFCQAARVLVKKHPFRAALHKLVRDSERSHHTLEALKLLKLRWQDSNPISQLAHLPKHSFKC